MHDVSTTDRPRFRCVLHGSFRKHFDAIMEARRAFTAAGIEVLAPTASSVAAMEGGFAFLDGEEGMDSRMVEMRYLHNLRRLHENGFSFFVNPEGYIGKTASYELGIAQAGNVPCFFAAPPADHPAYVHGNAVWTPQDLADHIAAHGRLPGIRVRKDERQLHRMWEELVVPGSVVAAGGMIEYDGNKREKDLLFVKTHKWGGRYSIVGGKVRRGERLEDALRREIREETGLDAKVGRHLCTFDQLRNSGYYRAGMMHIFVDNVARVTRRRVRLNDEAQEHVWMPARAALRDLDLEPNARHVTEIYAATMHA